MKIIFTQHAELRMGQGRQRKITRDDVINAVKEIPGKVDCTGMRFRCKTKFSKFDVVVKDDQFGNRIVITIVGLLKPIRYWS